MKYAHITHGSQAYHDRNDCHITILDLANQGTYDVLVTEYDCDGNVTSTIRALYTSDEVAEAFNPSGKVTFVPPVTSSMRDTGLDLYTLIDYVRGNSRYIVADDNDCNEFPLNKDGLAQAYALAIFTLEEWLHDTDEDTLDSPIFEQRALLAELNTAMDDLKRIV